MLLQNQPLYPARLDLTHPALAGSSAQIICFGDKNGFLRNAGNLIAQPTPNGSFTSGTTDAGAAIDFDGSTTYLDFGTAAIPADEFTALWGGIFDALTGVTGIVDGSNGSSNGWSLFTSGTDIYLSGNHYAGDLLSSGWATGTFYHGAARNKLGVGKSIFRNGAKIADSASSLTTVSNPTSNFLVGQLRVSSPRFINARFSYFYLFDKYLSDDLINSLQANPWQIFESEPEVVFYPVAASGINLIGSVSTQSNAASVAAITQGHALAGGDSAQANASAAAAITQVQVLTGAASSQGNASSTGAVTQGASFVGANCDQVNPGSVGTITQSHALAGAASAQGNVSVSVGATQNHVIAASGASQTNDGASGAITLGVAVNLVAAASTQANSSTTAGITQAHTLIHAPSVQDNIAAASVIVQSHILAGSNAAQANVGASGAILLGDVALISIVDRTAIFNPTLDFSATFNPSKSVQIRFN